MMASGAGAQRSSAVCRFAAKPLESERFRRDSVDLLRQLREALGFLLIGWVLMPEHFYLLLQAQPAGNTSLRMDRVD
jgi:REP element-mobilizing transposase RayT